MQKYSHIIGRQIFEVQCSSEAKGRELQDKISLLFNTELQRRIDALFEDIIPKSKHLRIGNLTIDLGNIGYESLDHELVIRIIEKLEREISLLLLHDNQAADTDAEPHSTDQEGSYLTLVEYFLLRGTLPWWAGTEHSASPFLAFDFLLTQSPQSLITLIMRVGQKAYVRKRLIYQFSEDQIKAFIGILEPSQAAFIFDYHAEVVNTQRKNLLVKNEEADFKKAVWDFIVTYLIVDRGSHFNRKEFVKSTLMSIAANFNVSFEGLLNLFASAIVPGAYNLKNVDSLQAIILEIAVERQIHVSEGTTVEDMLEIPVDTPDKGLDLLRYYLTFGSFPWWSMNVTEAGLQQLISVLVEKYPRTLESLIQSVGQRQYSRRLMVKTFKEDTLKEILVAIEPENSGLISDYIQEVKATHTRTSVLKTETENLREALWEFILEYLLVDRGSEFNRKVFLESNIKNLANRFNINFKDLVAFMVNNIAVAHSKSSRHLNLFQGLTSLYNENLDSREIAAATPVKQGVREQENRVSQANLKDVLYFWIKTGIMPWWAGRYANISPSVLVDKLTREAPLDAVTFLKHAGLQVKMRKRLVYQVPFETIFKLFGLLPSAAEALGYVTVLLSVVKNSKVVKYSDQTVADRVLLFSLWESMAAGSYQALKPVHFVSSVISKLALWFQISAGKLIASFNVDQDSEISRIIAEAHRYIQQNRTNVASYESDLLEEWAESNSIEEILTRLLIKTKPDPGGAGKEETLREALSLFLSFLKTGKLPGEFQHYSRSAINSFIKAMLLYLMREKPAELRAILDSGDYQGEHFLHIYELFSVPGSIEESSVAKLLQPMLEKNILLYIAQYGYIEHTDSILSFIDSYIKDLPGRNSPEFLRALLRYPSVSMQLAYYYKNEVTYGLIESNFIQIGWGNQTSGFLRAFNTWLMDITDDQLDRERLDLFFRTFNFMMIGGGVTAGSLKVYLSYFFKFLFERDYQLMLKLATRVEKLKPDEDKQNDTVIGASLADIRHEIAAYTSFNRISGKLIEGLNESYASSLKELIPDIESQLEAERKIFTQEIEQGDSENEEKKDLFSEHDKMYVHNAGLVILHPFLSTYFSRLQMLANGDFINEAMRHRAVMLLQYLAFGTETGEEHELVLNKLLCNLSVEEPIITTIELTDQERTISAELLKAVIAQWDKLKNSSPESLQASFIQRDGALFKTDDTWNLKVEQRGYDVLLQTLPWGLGMVKTPWMTNFIIIEWM
ncbi:MAG: contractile injection system tape measure protein [Daejeonella sp.]|uniref:contractile injection system tape measure protein n=1 Tax=Daejeonella sp. JGW-45 TaxID=3034148 RepID=UPI0023ED9F13|nr:contractile injection system tape measure protein [Daejeonella sp. JGW-45]